MTTSDAIKHGYTQGIIADCDAATLHLLIKPDTDLDGRFKAFDIDEQAFINVNGWLFYDFQPLFNVIG